MIRQIQRGLEVIVALLALVLVVPVFIVAVMAFGALWYFAVLWDIGASFCRKHFLLALLCAFTTATEAATVTAYDNAGPEGCAVCCGRWAPLNRTISGRRPQVGITVAAPRSVPLGTWVTIEGLGRRRVDDRTARRFDGRWDVFMPSHRDARRFGKRQLRVTIQP